MFKFLRRFLSGERKTQKPNVKPTISLANKPKPKYSFVISEAHDDYHLQIPGTELGNLTIYYCTDEKCVDLATSRAISQYSVDVIVSKKRVFRQTYKLGDPGFGRFRIYANGTEESVLGGYRPKCTNPVFKIRVSSPDAPEYTQCGRMKLMDDGTLKKGSCGTKC